MKKKRRILLLSCLCMIIFGITSCGNAKHDSEEMQPEDDVIEQVESIEKDSETDNTDVDSEGETDTEEVDSDATVSSTTKQKSESSPKEETPKTKPTTQKNENTNNSSSSKPTHTHTWVEVYKKVKYTGSDSIKQTYETYLCKGCNEDVADLVENSDQTLWNQHCQNHETKDQPSGWYWGEYQKVVVNDKDNEVSGDYKTIFGTRYIDVLTGYKCSCGATKSAE